ncbi:MAG: hypothetical protein OWR52_09090, partial [Acidibacillus sp.]|nr:hypothetical protein [Acidibacillus sp.]
FLFYPTNIIKVNHNNANYPLLKGTYTQETNQRIQLKRWLALYRSTHKLTIYFRGSHITIYELQETPPKKKHS